MKVLFFISAGNGDLINLTGPLHALKKEHPHIQIDLLIPKKHNYIVEANPDINQILYMDDYGFPMHCRTAGHAEAILRHFKNQYNFVINGWAVAHFPKHGWTERHADFATLSMRTLASTIVGLKTPRKECNPYWVVLGKDHEASDNVWEVNKTVVAGRPVVLVEAESFSWKSPNQPLVAETSKILSSMGWATAGNGASFDINTSSLNLKQIKDFFTRYCKGFAGISSGMTCAIYAESTDFSTKRMAINGLYPCWNLENLWQKRPERYTFGVAAYREPQIKAVFGGV